MFVLSKVYRYYHSFLDQPYATWSKKLQGIIPSSWWNWLKPLSEHNLTFGSSVGWWIIVFICVQFMALPTTPSKTTPTRNKGLKFKKALLRETNG